MRNLNEYKEEIFRRGQNRITARRVAVKRVLSFCIPLCLTLVVCSAAVLPQLFNRNDIQESAENASPESTGGKYDAYYDCSNGGVPTIDDENRSEEVNDSLDESEDSPVDGDDEYDTSAEVDFETSTETSDEDDALGPDDALPDDEIHEDLPNLMPPDNYGDDSAGEGEEFSFSLVWNCYGVSSYDSTTGVLVKTTDASNPEDYVTALILSNSEITTIYKLLNNLNVEDYPDIYSPHPDNFMSDPPMTLILTVNIGETTKTIAAKDIAYSFTTSDPDGQRFLTTCRQIIEILTSTDEWKELPEYENFYA